MIMNRNGQTRDTRLERARTRPVQTKCNSPLPTGWLRRRSHAQAEHNFILASLERVAFNLHDRAWSACDPTRARKTTAMIHFRLPKQSWPCMPGPVRLVRRPRPVIAPDFLLEFAGYFLREKSSKAREIFGTSRKKSGKNYRNFPISGKKYQRGSRHPTRTKGTQHQSLQSSTASCHPSPPPLPASRCNPPYTHTPRRRGGWGGFDAANRKRRKPETEFLLGNRSFTRSFDSEFYSEF